MNICQLLSELCVASLFLMEFQSGLFTWSSWLLFSESSSFVNDHQSTLWPLLSWKEPSWRFGFFWGSQCQRIPGGWLPYILVVVLSSIRQLRPLALAGGGLQLSCFEVAIHILRCAVIIITVLWGLLMMPSQQLNDSFSLSCTSLTTCVELKVPTRCGVCVSLPTLWL